MSNLTFHIPPAPPFTIAFKAGLTAIKRDKLGNAEVLVLLKGVKP